MASPKNQDERHQGIFSFWNGRGPGFNEKYGNWILPQLEKLGQWLNFSNFLGLLIFSRGNYSSNFFFQGPLAKWENPRFFVLNQKMNIMVTTWQSDHLFFFQSEDHNMLHFTKKEEHTKPVISLIFPPKISYLALFPPKSPPPQKSTTPYTFEIVGTWSTKATQKWQNTQPSSFDTTKAWTKIVWPHGVSWPWKSLQKVFGVRKNRGSFNCWDPFLNIGVIKEWKVQRSRKFL